MSITGDIYGHVSPDVSAQAMDALGAALDAMMVVRNGGHEAPTKQGEAVPDSQNGL